MEIFNCIRIALNLSAWWLLYFKTYILKNVKQNILHAFFLILKTTKKGKRKKKSCFADWKTPKPQTTLQKPLSKPNKYIPNEMKRISLLLV